MTQTYQAFQCKHLDWPKRMKDLEKRLVILLQDLRNRGGEEMPKGSIMRISSTHRGRLRLCSYENSKFLAVQDRVCFSHIHMSKVTLVPEAQCVMCDWGEPSQLHADGMHYHGKSRCSNRTQVVTVYKKDGTVIRDTPF